MGPKTQFSQELHRKKYRLNGEDFEQFSERLASSISDSKEHFDKMLEMISEQRFLPAGRIQSAMGSPYGVTPMNCFLGGKIEDSMSGIMDELKDSALTLRMGGGCGWDFSTIRPSGDKISTLDAEASGPVSMMGMWDSMCDTVMSKGLRRGAMMGVLRIDHPDIIKFIQAKRNLTSLNNFNISVAVTDEFMDALKNDGDYELRFNGSSYGKISATKIWNKIMENTWDYAEPGVLFIDTINKQNPLHYTECIAAVNPCGEIPLPPHGTCLLASFNLVKYLHNEDGKIAFNYHLFKDDIRHAVRAVDLIIDKAKFPLSLQQIEAKLKRRMGIGVTGVANAIELMGHRYASKGYIEEQNAILESLRNEAYLTSVELAIEKGSFPLFDEHLWNASGYAQSLPEYVRKNIFDKGLRNGLLLSIAPTGTISLCADNVSSGIEPPYMLAGTRLVNTEEGKKTVELKDWALENHGHECRTAENVTADEHVSVLVAAQRYIDNAISKTCNIGDSVNFEQFKDVYLKAYEGGAKGCTTFRSSGKRYGIMNPKESDKEDGAACFIDPETGIKECS